MILSNPSYNESRIVSFNDRADKYYSNRPRIDVFTVKVELTKNGVKSYVWSEKGVLCPKSIILPSTQLLHNDLLKPRKKVVVKGEKNFMRGIVLLGRCDDCPTNR